MICTVRACNRTKSWIYNQFKDRTRRDWVNTVISDLALCKLNVTFEDIQSMTKPKWKSIVKTHISEKSLKDLEIMKQRHSKVMELKHPNLTIQEYLLPNKQKISKEETQLIFRMRCKVTNVKMNMNGLYDNHECEVCLSDEETQKRIYECKEIWKIRGTNF